jgi:FtsH-binding integral membrane protein
MHKVAGWMGWTFLIIGGALILLGVAAWPPGGLMFALPFIFLIPGVPLALVGGMLVWLSQRRRSAELHTTERQ